MSSNYLFSNKRELNSIGNIDNIKVSYVNCLKGHNNAIEDISFHPRDRDILISVGDDRKIIGWDLRSSQ